MNITVPLWLAFAVFVGVIALTSAQERIHDRWEIARGRPRVTRRWYGTHAQVTLRAAAGADDPDLFRVLQWSDEETTLPWLLVHRLDSGFLTYLDEDAEAFWAPVTDFAPYAVRRFRPGVTLIGRVPVVRLTQYPPLPIPARLPEGVRDAA